MKRTITQAEIKENLENIPDIAIKQKEPGYNVIYLNTPFGQKIIKTTLSLEEWLEANQMKPKKQTKKKK